MTAGDSEANPRWWFDPALARLAFASTVGAEHGGGFRELFALDLDDPTQRVLGEFELRELIGQGGMGVVYRAHQTRLQREVAVKLLSDGPWASTDFIGRFQQEACHAAQLQHPAIVTVYELGEADGLAYYAMELVRGQSLAHRLRATGPWSPREAAALIRSVAEAVDYAHRLGVLHLDLKPGNLLLDTTGQVKIADFGLARRFDPEGRLDRAPPSGTPGYMAPEQADPALAPLSPATDVWSLGAILYELLTGRAPMDAAEPPLEQLRIDAVQPPRRLRPVPIDLDAICMKCLAYDPRSRYDSARRLADDLGRFLEGLPVSVHPLNSAQRAWHWARREPRLAATAAIAAFAVLVGLVATTREWRRAEHNAEVARTQLWEQRSDQAWRAISEGHELDALMPLTRNLVEQEASGAEARAADTRLRIGGVLSQAPSLIQTIAVGQPVYTVTLANDGSWLAAGTDDGRLRLYELPSRRERWSVDTRKATHFMMQAPHLGHLWTAGDGRHLLAARPYPEQVPYPSGSNQLLIDLRDGSLWKSALADFRDATFSPDGGYVLVRTQHLRTRLEQAGDGRALSPWRTFDASQPAWLLAPQGRYVAMSTAPFRTVELWDGHSLRTRAAFGFDEASALRSWTFDADGKRLLLGHRDGRISLIDTASGRLTRLDPQRPASVEHLQTSDDGQWLGAGYNDGHALVWDLTRGELLTEPIPVTEGVFSLILDHGTRTLFVRDEAQADVWRMPQTHGPALLLHRRPQLPETRYGRSNGWAPEAGLLATGTLDGEIRLWRTHRQPPLPWAPAPQPSDTAFDGRHVVAVDGARVQVMDAFTQEPAGPPIVHPQPVGFAFLANGGDTLIASAGADVHASDWRRGVPRFAPIRLGNSPNRLLAPPAGKTLIASELTSRAGRGQTQLTAWSLEDGRALASTQLEGPVHGLRLSGDGRHLLAWRIGELHVLDARTLAPSVPMRRLGADTITLRRAMYASAGPVEVNDPAAFWGEEIMDADIDPVSGRIWVLTNKPGLLDLPLAGGAPAHDVFIPMQMLVRVEALPGRGAAVLSADQGLLLFTPTGALHTVASTGRVNMGVMARSGDGRRLAISTGQGVTLFNARGDWLTPPLRLLDDPDDPLHSITLDRRGETLLVQTYKRRYAMKVPVALRPAAELAELAPLWRPSDALGALAANTTVEPPASTPHRLDARQHDPGAASMAPPSPPDEILPALRPTDPHFVDLRPHCNLLGASSDDTWPPAMRLRTVPRGRQRLLGRDFWIDCGILTDMGAAAAGPDGHPLPRRVGAIAVGVPRFSALDVLLTGWGTTASFATVPYASIELHYRNGTVAALPIEGRTQVWAWWHEGSDLPEQPLAYLSQFANTSTMDSWLSLARHYAVRLRNPHPEREVQSIAISTTNRAWSSPIVLAITLEQADIAVDAPSPPRAGRNGNGR